MNSFFRHLKILKNSALKLKCSVSRNTAAIFPPTAQLPSPHEPLGHRLALVQSFRCSSVLIVP